ncbi:MAG: hypothetical protein EBZ05_07085, partial [Verrucomicrobia bacterium]|nr:hypothetical protein [Verrucomicrobiota bacterium]
ARTVPCARGLACALLPNGRRVEGVWDGARILLEWGCPFAVYWQFYCNEPNEKKSEGYEGFWLVDSKNRETPLYSDFVRYFREMRNWSERQKEAGKKIGPNEVKAEAIQFIQKLQVNESN